jgi:hypothetical protein
MLKRFMVLEHRKTPHAMWILLYPLDSLWRHFHPQVDLLKDWVWRL